MPAAHDNSALPLRDSTLSLIRDSIARPIYSRALMPSRVVHIGVGGFNRSHLAVYLDDLLSGSASDRWGELGIGLLASDKQINHALTSQDCLYGVLERDGDREEYRVVGSLVGHLYAPECTAMVLERLSAPECSIISLTVTEGGYFTEDASGRVLVDHPDIQYDLGHPDSPRTWLGYVAASALSRMQRGSQPFTLLSCDNLQSNGATAREALLAFADGRSAELRRWIESNIAFPNSMVDRITPKTTQADRDHILKKFGIADLSPVVCESFRQWVLEDEFAAGRPAWESVGALMTIDVAPYEKTKIRLLNGGHSAIGYAADLTGLSYISEAATDPLLRELLIHFLEEVRQTLTTLPGIDLEEYSATIVSRFSNPTIRDQVARICSNGCSKIARFIVPSLRDALRKGIQPRIIPVVLAAWLHYVAIREGSTTFEDPSIFMLRPFLAAGGSEARIALGERSLFGEIAVTHPRVVGAVQICLDAFRSREARAVIAEALLRTNDES
ncbi:MAG: mannitol dehydrogenase family protein [Candidatus Sulfotelmatobacter sp.]